MKPSATYTSSGDRKRGGRSVAVHAAIALVFLCGLALVLYPTASDAWNQWRQNQLMDGYDDAVQQLAADDNAAEKEAARQYNAALSPAFSDAFAGAEPAPADEYWRLLNVSGNGIMGYIEIPKIDVRLPIYHGVGSEALEHGVGHLPGTSLPVGGMGTHCVLSGHRGLPSAMLFTDLDQLEVGDRFALHVLGDTLAYEVDQVLVVEPNDVSNLLPEQNGDYVTLLTCTPYGVNTQRLLVRGHRVDSMGDAGSASDLGHLARSFGWKGEVLLSAVAVVALAFMVLAQKKRREAKEGDMRARQ